MAFLALVKFIGAFITTSSYFLTQVCFIIGKNLFVDERTFFSLLDLQLFWLISVRHDLVMGSIPQQEKIFEKINLTLAGMSTQPKMGAKKSSLGK